jgi:hypothetical protein
VLEVRFDGEGLHWGELYEAVIQFTCDPAVAVPVVYTLMTGTGEPESGPEITIFPNSAGEQLVIGCLEPVLQINIYDHLGRWVARFTPPQRKKIYINTTDLPFGLYYVEAEIPGERKVVKMTIVF